MVVYYEQSLSIDMIVTEIEAFLDWKDDVLRQCFFPEAQNHKVDQQAPHALLDWCKREQDRLIIEDATIDRMESVLAQVSQAGRKCMDHCASGQKLTVELFDAFEHQCEALINQVRRLQQDMSDFAVAVDAVTGLRTMSGMHNDIRREQDRCDRKSTPYSIAVAEIDNIDGLLSQYDRRTMDSIYAHVARTIAGTMRSFDDAYFLGRGEYVLVIKHLDFIESCSVLDRLRHKMEDEAFVTTDGTPIQITLSFGITEPLPTDTPELSVEHAKTALLDAKERGGNCVLEYKEMSGLQRYVQDMKQNS